MTALELIAEAEKQGLTIKATGNYLDVIPGRLCPADFAQKLRAHKPALLALLRLPFVMVFSEVLGETIFFCKDETTKDALVEAGAEPWSIYTHATSCASWWRRTAQSRFSRMNSATCTAPNGPSPRGSHHER